LESQRKCDEATKTKNLASLYSLSDMYGQISHDDTYSDILKAALVTGQDGIIGTRKKLINKGLQAIGILTAKRFALRR